MSTSRRHTPGARRSHSGGSVDLAPTDTSDEAAIGARIEPRSDGCWIWTGATNGHGYGQCPKGGLAHRFVYETLVGPIPSGMVVHHRCETPPCCNPEHLELMTRSDHSSHHARRKIA